jgi:hypothetical protein
LCKLKRFLKELFTFYIARENLIVHSELLVLSLDPRLCAQSLLHIVRLDRLVNADTRVESFYFWLHNVCNLLIANRLDTHSRLAGEEIRSPDLLARAIEGRLEGLRFNVLAHA